MASFPGWLLLLVAVLCATGWGWQVCRKAGAMQVPRRGWMWCAGLAASLGLWVSWNLLVHPQGQCVACVDWQAADRVVQDWALQPAHAQWMPAVQTFTRLGDVETITVIGLIAAAVLAWRRAWAWLAGWTLGLVGVGLSVQWIKLWVQRERPSLSWVVEDSYSFPSGHSAGGWVCYGLLAWWALRSGTGCWRLPLAVVAATLAVGIGISRAVLGVHFLSDVAAGWCLGLLWMALALILADRLSAHTPQTAGAAAVSGIDDR